MESTTAFWVRFSLPASTAAGIYHGIIRLVGQGIQQRIRVTLTVWPFALPHKTHFLMTNWLFMAPLITRHQVEPLSERFWQVLERYAINLAAHRQVMILTYLFHFPLVDQPNSQLIDVREVSKGQYAFTFKAFDRWVSLFLKHGFQIIEGGASRRCRRTWRLDTVSRRGSTDPA